MLDYLKEKRDVGFFKSLSGLMQSCRYHDYNAEHTDQFASALATKKIKFDFE